jgi:hypothetical protein
MQSILDDATAHQRSGYDFLSHRPWLPFPGEIGATVTSRPLDRGLVRRAITAYQTAASAPRRDTSMWQVFFDERHSAAHAALMAGDAEAVAAFWQNPSANFVFWGFEDIHPIYTEHRQTMEGRLVAAHRVYDNLIRLAEAVGADRMEYPEAPTSPSRHSANDIIAVLDGAFGYRIDFPNPYANEFGLETSRGVIGYRTVQALYQAYRTTDLAKGGAGRILEIGPGLGRAAYYCNLAGVSDYTLIDIPFSGVSQALFLGTVLSPDAIQLTGENHPAPIKIKAPDAFLSDATLYDVIVNFDSLTEMDEATQRAYMAKIRECAGTFLSVNHEYNAVTVLSLLREFFPGKKVSRDPYWMRRGYVQEIVRR